MARTCTWETSPSDPEIVAAVQYMQPAWQKVLVYNGGVAHDELRKGHRSK